MTLATERPATRADEIAGVAAGQVFEPSSREECVEVLRALHAKKHALAARGGGTELGLGAPPTRLDAVVSTQRLDRGGEYAPADPVVVVESRVNLSALQ